ncbi:MFS transporter [Mycoplasma putrefaciens]|uniref:Major Facilitator Superfamily protein n=1 Tax=Mycoplasma putrefaciens (strain ATCC 15718 / NCTC 10155 / C30 KS-1 / KS-1) TaxID=743965 RepID=A0A7U3ZSF7_MYCPK|nr:MFS transporter [Mycoplasma putrefaciens]AEM68687.1 Major Facilitator Superfamily protein [Mycoplasma putrefaciens KS1]
MNKLKNPNKVKSPRKIKNVFNWLNEKQAEPLTQDNLYDFVVKKEFKHNQNLTFVMAFLGYLVYYFTRKQWTIFGSIITIGSTNAEGIITGEQFALVGLVFSIAYGLSKFLTSPLSDTKSNRWLLGIGLIGAGIINFLVGVSFSSKTNITASVVGTCILMVLAGYLHSLGATPSVRLIYKWFNHNSRRNRMIVWNISHNIGGALAVSIIPLSYTVFGPSLGLIGYFVIPSLASVITGILVVIFAKDRPEQVGLPALEKYYNLQLIGKTQHQQTDEDNKPYSYFFVKYILKNKWIWLLVIANICTYTIRAGLSDFALRYLRDVQHFDIEKEGGVVYSLLDWGAVVLTLIVGLSINKWFKRFVPILILTVLITTLATVGIWQSKDNKTLLIISMFLGGFIFIPQSFFAMLSGEFSHHRVVSTAGGILGITSYVFADGIISKVGIGIGILGTKANNTTPTPEQYQNMFILMIVLGVVACLSLLPMWNKKVSGK